MPWHSTLLICLLTLLLPPSSPTLVSFSNVLSTEPSTFQVCNTAHLPDTCCTPLDLDLHNGHGYGWFRAELVAFSRIDTPETFTTVFGRRSPRPCHYDVVAAKQGKPDWQYAIGAGALERGGAGSASVVRSAQPASLKQKHPDVVIVRDVRYYFAFESMGLFTYMDQTRNLISGRPFASSPAAAGAAANRTAVVDEQ